MNILKWGLYLFHSHYFRLCLRLCVYVWEFLSVLKSFPQVSYLWMYGCVSFIYGCVSENQEILFSWVYVCWSYGSFVHMHSHFSVYVRTFVFMLNCIVRIRKQQFTAAHSLSPSLFLFDDCGSR